MKRFLPLLILLIVISTILCIPASASDGGLTESETFTYPSFQELENMKNALPKTYKYNNVSYKFDNAVIGFAPDGTIKCYLWDYDYSHAQISNNYSQIIFYSGDSGYAFTTATWDSRGFWVSYKTYDEKPNNIGYSVPISKDFLIYTKSELTNQSSVVVAPAGKTYGVVAPDWKTLTWDNCFKDLPTNMMGEIISILPILLVVVISFIAIRKGISFFLSILRHS